MTQSKEAIERNDVLSLIAEISATGSRTTKSVLLSHLSEIPLGLFALKKAYDPFITYGIKPKAPKVKPDGNSSHISISLIEPLLDQLARRELTGHAAEKAVTDMFERLDNADAHLLWGILLKDLKCGIGASMINQAIPNLIPTFSVMRAHKYEEKRIKEWPVRVEYKLDGQRNVFICRNNSGGFFTRSGKSVSALDFMVRPILEGARHAVTVSPKLATVLGEVDNLNFVLDGEAMMGLFEDTGALRRVDKQATDAELHLYDILSYEEFNAEGSAGKPFTQRRAMLNAFIFACNEKLVKANITPLRLVPQFEANSHEEIESIFKMVRQMPLARYLANGDKEREAHLAPLLIDRATGKPKVLEGLIIKLPMAKYDKRKSFNWLKVKAEETEDLRVVDAFSGEPHTKFENSLGGLIVDRNGVRVRIGGGFTDVERDALWQLFKEDSQPDAQPQLLGRLIEVEFHEVTPDGSLRHPRFVRFRDDKDGEYEQAA